MNIKISVVAKKDNKWYIGYINNDKFIINDEVKKLADVKEVSNYKTIKKFLHDRKIDLSVGVNLMKKLGLESVYVLDMPIKPTEKEFENYWWDGINKKCETCSKQCKQSPYVNVVSCKLYNKK